jgi:CHAD domain-containing protein
VSRASGSEFLPASGMTLDAAADALALRLDLQDGAAARETDRVFYDTFDGLLYRAGLSSYYEEGELTLIERESGALRAHLPMPTPTGPLVARELGPGALRDAILPIVDVRALLPLAQVRSRRRAISVLDDERKTVVRLTLEGSVRVGSDGSRTALAPRLRVTPVRGYDGELAHVRATLERELGFTATAEPLVDEAVRATGGEPGGISSKIAVSLRRDERADRAVAGVLHTLLVVIEANVEGTIADIDSEFLHDFRVSVRRTRALQRQCKQVFPPQRLAGFRAEFRWLQLLTGDARDLDVYVLDFESMRARLAAPVRSDLDPLLGVLRDRRSAARSEMASALRSEQVSSLLARWSAFLEELEGLPEADRPDAARPISAVAGERISKVYRRMVKMGGAIDVDSPAEAYHELRKKGKELRYLLELLGAPVYPAEVVRPMIKSLKALQDVLGRHQDREVQVATLSSLRDDVAAARGGTRGLMAMGALVARLREDELAARSEFSECFSSFASKSQRKLVGDTFG